MTEGMYFVQFASSIGVVGEGLIVLANGLIHGGDAQYLYRGTYAQYGDSIVANLVVSHYRGIPNSVFGPLRTFRLTLRGTYGNNVLSLVGNVVENSSFVISISGSKVAEIYKPEP